MTDIVKVKELLVFIGSTLGDLGEGYTVEDAIFFQKYFCWPEKVGEYLSLPLKDDKRSAVRSELFKRSLVEHVEEYRRKKGGFCYVADAIANGKRVYRPVTCSSLEVLWGDDFYFDRLPSRDCVLHMICWIRDFIAHYELNALSGDLRVEDSRYVCSFVSSMRQCNHALTPEQRFQVAELVFFYAQNAVFESQYAFLLKSLLLGICEFLKRNGIDQDLFNRELEILRGSMQRVGESVSPLGYDESFDDSVFFDWYGCWSDEVKALYASTDSNIQWQHSDILKHDLKSFAERWLFDARQDSFVTAKSILEGKRIFRDYSYADYVEYFNDQLGGFRHLSERSYIFVLAIWFKQTLREYEEYWHDGSRSIDYLDSIGEIRSYWDSRNDIPDISQDVRRVFCDGFKFLLKYNAFEHCYGVAHMLHVMFLINVLNPDGQ